MTIPRDEYDRIAAAYQSGYASLPPEHRQSWYGSIADAYNRTRPRYPQAIVDRAIAAAQLSANARILEVGCGPGIATVPFAQQGFSMVCLEPNQQACDLARQNCSHYPNVEIVNTTFEDWTLEDKGFAAVLAATSFHWVAPEVAYRKAAMVLQDSGFLILLWNMTPQPKPEVCQALQAVYQTLAPALGQYEPRSFQEESLRRFGQKILDSGQFQNLAVEQLPCNVAYSIDDYLSLLSTLSPYIALDPQRRNTLFAGLKEVLEQIGGDVQTSYLSACQVAQKISALR